jgi:hypothetical protein
MLWTVCAILVVLWLIGLVTSYTLGGFIHLLLVLAIIVLAIRLAQRGDRLRRKSRPRS